MEKEDFSGKVEDAVVGIIQFALRLGRTLLHLMIKPGNLLVEVRDDFHSRQYLAPHAYLLSCAIVLGVFGKFLALGFGQAGAGGVWASIKTLTLSSFINHSVPVFGIAIAAAVLVEVFLPKQQPDKKRQFKNLNYYIIGFFGIGGIVVLVLLSALLNLTFDQFGRGSDVFVSGSIIAIIGYVTAIFFLLFWLTSRAIRGEETIHLPMMLIGRILLINLVVIALCVINFASPLYKLEEGAPVLTGRKIDLAKQSDQSLRLTFLLSNVSDTDVVISRYDEITVFAKSEDGAQVEAVGNFCLVDLAKNPERGFLLIAPGKSDILAACVQSQPLHDLLGKAGFADLWREEGGDKYVAGGKSKLTFSVLIEHSIGDQRDNGRPIEL